MSKSDYQACMRCIMDTTDPGINFDSDGVCNHCHEFDEVTSQRWYPNAEGEALLRKATDRIKREGEGED